MTQQMKATEAIPDILEIYRVSLMAGDPDRWISNWTEDCVQLPPGGPMNIGIKMLYESISAWLSFFNASEFEIWDIKIQDMGDWAYSHLNYSYKLKPKDGSPSYVYEGKALTIYQQQSDGAWKIHRDCFNSNTPD